MSAEIERKIEREKLRLIYGQGPVLVFGSTLCAVMLTAFLWRSLPQQTLIFWLGALGATTAVRVVTIRAYHASAEPEHPRWGPLFWLGTLTTGVIWGAWPLMFHSLYDIEFLLLISTIFAGMVAVSAAAGGIYLPSFLSFSMPLVIPLSAAHLLSGRESLMLTGVLLLMFLGINFFLAWRGNRQNEALIRAQFRNEELMRRLAEEKGIAERAVVAKSRFLAAASHDLRQPLHAIGLFLGALERRESDSGQLALIDDMGKSADALNGLFDSLLDVSRLDAAIIEFRPSHLAVHSIFDRLRATFVQQASAKGIELVIERGEGCTIFTDGILFERVLGNLVANAVQYTPTGSVRLDCRPLDSGSCRVTLVDTGIGIPSSERDDVFSEYHQLNNPERDRDKGLGLGLAIVRRLAELMKMPLEMDSEVGVGTTFRLMVPGGDPAQLDAPAPARTVVAEGDGRTVLVIDDERQVLQAMRHMLEGHGYRVMLAESARDALRVVALGERLPEAILSDYRLRGSQSGIDAVVALRESLGVGIPAVIVSGDTSPERLKEVKDTGLEILHKPVAPDALHAVLERLLRARGVGAQSAAAPLPASPEVALTSRPMVRPCTRIDSTTIT